MQLIDLSLPLTHHMPVFPGDPEVEITEIHTLAREGWRLRSLSLTTHIGTHVNVPFHMVENGKTLSQYPLETFIGKAILYTPNARWSNSTGVIFADQNIDSEICDQLIAHPPKFIGLSSAFEFDIALEKNLLEHNIISFENLINTQLLPSAFIFYGIPLNIDQADGSPVRAFAEIE